MKFQDTPLAPCCSPASNRYAVYALWEQFTGDYRPITTQYALMLAVPVLLLAALVTIEALIPSFGKLAITSWLFKTPELGTDDTDVAKEPTQEDKRVGGAFRVIALVGAASALVYFLEDIGYPICFFVFVVVTMLALGLRSVFTILLAAVLTTLMVHFIFVGLLGLDLPLGLLEDLLDTE